MIILCSMNIYYIFVVMINLCSNRNSLSIVDRRQIRCVQNGPVKDAIELICRVGVLNFEILELPVPDSLLQQRRGGTANPEARALSSGGYVLLFPGTPYPKQEILLARVVGAIEFGRL